ncbi:MAG: C40 family peptidase [Treponema sp.]|jgi:hypothetical protein|nr:C40 family peptidase [Treponema sp.]
MRNVIVKAVLFVFFLFCARTGECQDNSITYKAVIRTYIAGVHERAGASTPLVTQALLNEEIEVFSTRGSFVFALVPDGYTGYIRASDITRDLSSIQADGDKIIIVSPFAAIYDQGGREIYKAPMSSVFFGISDANRYIITLPENITGYIDKEDAMCIDRYADMPFGTGRGFADIAKMFLGVRYLWGGCSAEGIDCSGLTYIAAKMNGLRLPRDSMPQSENGVYVDLRNAVIGDQLFFSSDAGRARVAHTGIYLGRGDFIHSAGNSGVVIDNIYDNQFFYRRFMFAKRYF